jgi:hypothetical protein
VVSTTPRPLYPREIPGTHCTGGWVGPRAGLDVCEKSRPHGIPSPDRPARSQSLHRLSYPAHLYKWWDIEMKLMQDHFAVTHPDFQCSHHFLDSCCVLMCRQQ